MVEEARLEVVKSGFAPVSPGWFVVNARDVAWLTNDRFGGICIFESDDYVLRGRPDLEEQEFAHAGFTLHVIQPGQPSTLYHAESEQQEDFLVLVGECVLLVEGEERRLRTWDFVHFPPGTAHSFVGTGDGPCVLLGAGNRTDDSVTVYLPDERAHGYGAAVESETADSREAHAGSGEWRHERPPQWNELPWAAPEPAG